MLPTERSDRLDRSSDLGGLSVAQQRLPPEAGRLGCCAGGRGARKQNGGSTLTAPIGAASGRRPVGVRTYSVRRIVAEVGVSRHGYLTLCTYLLWLASWATGQERATPSSEKVLTGLIAGIRESKDRQQRHWAIEGLCAKDWPPPLIPKVVETLTLVLEDEPASWIANALRNFAAKHPAEAAALVPKIAGALSEADPGDRVEFAIALRSIGPRAVNATDSLRELLAHQSPVVRIHGASALARIRPNNRQCCDLLFNGLSDKSAHVPRNPNGPYVPTAATRRVSFGHRPAADE